VQDHSISPGQAVLNRRAAVSEHPLATVEETARLLRVSEMTVRRAIRSGRLPAVIFGRSYRVPRAFVAGLLADAAAGQTVVVTDRGASWSGVSVEDVA
jgi:excisionase family DNA binding protein